MANFVPDGVVVMRDLALANPKLSAQSLDEAHQALMAAYAKRLLHETAEESRSDALFHAKMNGVDVSISRDERRRYLEALAAEADKEVFVLEERYNIGPY